MNAVEVVVIVVGKVSESFYICTELSYLIKKFPVASGAMEETTAEPRQIFAAGGLIGLKGLD